MAEGRNRGDRGRGRGGNVIDLVIISKLVTKITPSTFNNDLNLLIQCVLFMALLSPFCEQNNMRAVNRTCERFCVCDSHACLSH